MPRHALRVVALGVGVVLLGTALVSHATSLGGLATSPIGAWSDPDPVLPSLVTCDDFGRPAPTGLQLQNRPVQHPGQCGALRWSTHRGSWTLEGAWARASGTQATASLAVGQTNVSVEATVALVGSGALAAGVVINHNGANNQRYLAAALTSTGSVELRLGTGPTSFTVLASASTSWSGQARLKITRVDQQVRVTVNGALVLSHTLTASQLSTLGSGTAAGLYDQNGGGRLRDIAVSRE